MAYELSSMILMAICFTFQLLTSVSKILNPAKQFTIGRRLLWRV